MQLHAVPNIADSVASSNIRKRCYMRYTASNTLHEGVSILLKQLITTKY